MTLLAPIAHAMSIWTSNVHRSTTDAAESLLYSPSGGRAKLWLLGVGLALLPLSYGVRCLFTGYFCTSTQRSTKGTAALTRIAFDSHESFHYQYCGPRSRPGDH